ELTQAAGVIAVGVVEGVHTTWNESHSMIFTDYDVRVEDSLKGEPERVLQVRTPGGTLDGITINSCLTIHLEPGRRYILFLAPSGMAPLVSVLAAEQGAVREVVDPRSGDSRAVPLSGPFWLGWEHTKERFDDVVTEIRMLVARSGAGAPTGPKEGP